jgi:uncharacterized protein
MHPLSGPHESVDPAIRCDACEAVCCRLDVILLPGDSVPAWLTDRDEHGMELMAKANDGWCVALDRTSMRCTIYARRPFVCAEFAMGGSSCSDERDAWYGNRPSAIPVTVIA